LPNFRRLLGDGSRLGMVFEYCVQPSPDGLAQAFILGEEFLAGGPGALILGDNIFYGAALSTLLQGCTRPDGGLVFAYHVSDPERYGVVEFDSAGRVLSIEEKPSKPKSNYAIPGLYFFDSNAPAIARGLKPSPRGELEIVDLIRHYLNEGRLGVRVLTRGTAWLDTGTHGSLLQAGQFVQIVEERQGLKVGCIEEIAWRMGWMSDDMLRSAAQPLLKSGYGRYLLAVLEEGRSRG
jgi:glucose-1-phosphate thymidylyltransferase